MNRNYLIIGVVVLVLIAGFLMFKGSNKTTVDDQNAMTPAESTAPESSPAASDSAMTNSPEASGDAMTAGVKEFTVSGSSFKFEPNTLTVKKGDKVKITFKNVGGMHNFVIDEFKVESKTIQGGAEDTVEFTADKAGTFEYYCAIGNHRAMGMKGTLTVQ